MGWGRALYMQASMLQRVTPKNLGMTGEMSRKSTQMSSIMLAPAYVQM